MKPQTTLPTALCLLALGTLTGCYTQLATRGYGSAEPAPNGAAAATGYPAHADSAYGDSALAQPMEADTLAPESGAPTVIVNNYYDPVPSYRGYAGWEWDFPALSFGYYSSRYGHYSRPYWWDDPWYVRRHSHGHHPHRHPSYRPSRPVSGGTLSGPYRSEKRLFNPEPEYPSVRKGRRSYQPSAAPAQSEPVPQVAPKPSAEASGSPTRQQGNDNPPAISGGSASGGGASEAKPAKDDSGKDGDYPRLNKGRRR